MHSKIQEITIAVVGDNERTAAVYKHLEFKEYNVHHLSTNQLCVSLKSEVTSFGLIILVGCSKILSREEMRGVKAKFLTCHAGLLPEYRGSSPLNWAIINDEKFFGLSVIETTEKIDAGNIYETARFDLLNNMTINDLHKIANEQFPYMVEAAILKIHHGVPPIEQIQADARYYPRRDRNDAKVLFKNITVEELIRLHRAVSEVYHYPWFSHSGTEIEIIAVRPLVHFRGSPGKIYQIKHKEILVMCADHGVWLTLNTDLPFSKYEALD